VAGGAAVTVVTGWIKYPLIALTIVLLTRSFCVLYVQKRGGGFVKVLTWLSAVFVVCFWSWQLWWRGGEP
jgi:hypothetical protein